jgi:hypothetical protein
MENKVRKSSKTVFTATYQKAQYTGTHPEIKNKLGVFFFNKDQNSYVFRPDSDNGLKSDWYRVHLENLAAL